MVNIKSDIPTILRNDPPEKIIEKVADYLEKNDKNLDPTRARKFAKAAVAMQSSKEGAEVRFKEATLEALDQLDFKEPGDKLNFIAAMVYLRYQKYVQDELEASGNLGKSFRSALLPKEAGEKIKNMGTASWNSLLSSPKRIKPSTKKEKKPELDPPDLRAFAQEFMRKVPLEYNSGTTLGSEFPNPRVKGKTLLALTAHLIAQGHSTFKAQSEQGELNIEVTTYNSALYCALGGASMLAATYLASPYRYLGLWNPLETLSGFKQSETWAMSEDHGVWSLSKGSKKIALSKLSWGTLDQLLKTISALEKKSEGGLAGALKEQSPIHQKVKGAKAALESALKTKKEEFDQAVEKQVERKRAMGQRLVEALGPDVAVMKVPEETKLLLELAGEHKPINPRENNARGS